MKNKQLSLSTNSKMEFVDITRDVRDFVRESEVQDGLLLVYCPHTTAAITINENADPSVRYDIQQYLTKLIPQAGPYTHLEGNSPAHIASSLIGSSVTIPIISGTLALGTWQGIYFCEFDGPRHRRVLLSIR